jgi:hypothetical protein
MISYPHLPNFRNLSSSSLQDHISFCARALADRFSINIVIEPSIGAIPLWKHVFRTKAPTLELQFSSGHLGHQMVSDIAKVFEKQGLAYRSKFTKHRGQLSRVTMSFDTKDLFSARAIVRTLEVASGASGVQSPTFSITYFGRPDKNYRLRPGDPLYSTWFEAGVQIGNAAGTLARAWKRLTSDKSET